LKEELSSEEESSSKESSPKKEKLKEELSLDEESEKSSSKNSSSKEDSDSTVEIIDENKDIEELKFQEDSGEGEDVESIEESSSESSSGEDLQINNSISNSIREKDVVIGVVYICVDMSTFLKKDMTFEEEINEAYNSMSLNEINLRMERLKKIKDRCYFMVKKAEENLVILEEKEKKIKTDLSRLTVVLAQSDALKERINKNPKKYGEIEDEAMEVREQTCKTIEDLNIELLMIRDDADEILINCSETIEELIEDLSSKKNSD